MKYIWVGWKEQINSYALGKWLGDSMPQWFWLDLYVRTMPKDSDYPDDVEIPF